MKGSDIPETSALAPTAFFPPHATEEVPWSFRRRIRGVDTYTASVPPLIQDVTVQVGAGTMAVVREALASMAVLDHSAAGQLTAIEPFLARTEAIASSRIEEELTTVDQLARAQVGAHAPRKARVVSAAYDGLRALVEAAGSHDLVLADVLGAHRVLMLPDVTEASEAGRLRTVQNWIGGAPGHPVGASHVPPRPGRVPALMEDLIAFMRRNDVDPVVQSAIAHAQFESIHPFTDGNGRIGRALMNALWRARGVTRSVSVPIAAALAAHRSRYFSALDRYREGDVDTVTEVVAECATEASEAGCASAARLKELPGQWRAQVSVRSDSAAARLIDQLVERPVVDVEDVRLLTGASAAAAYRALERLEEAGVLRRLTESRRDTLWGAADVLDEADRIIAGIAAGGPGL